MMSVRQDGVSIVQGEISMLLSSMRRGSRWSGHVRTEEERDPLIHGLHQLQETLNNTSDLTSLKVSVFLKPFCDIVQSDDSTGPVTGMAITALDKFLAYGLIDSRHPSAPNGIENLSEAVTHARFVGTNPASDEVVLMKILQVLHTLMLTPVGSLLSNESVCEIMQSCFRICFEMRLSELLRCFAEGTLVDMVQLLFTRLPTFTEDSHSVNDTSSMDQTLTHERRDSQKEQLEIVAEEDESPTAESNHSDEGTESHDQEGTNEAQEEFVSSDVICVTSRHKHGSLAPPYGLPCVRELLRFLISIINVRDRHNSELFIGIGLKLITVALECGASHICLFPSLTPLVQDGLCRNLFCLLRDEDFLLFSRALRTCFLLFESCNGNLKLQLEMFMNRLMELVTSENSHVPYDRKELVLECVVQLCHIPHFMAEMYVNFDCGLYCTNIFENLTKMLSKNAFPTQGLYTTHLLSLDALLAIIHNFENNGTHDMPRGNKRLSENPEALSLSLQQGHKLASSSTQLNSAGLIFTSSAGREEEEVTSSNEKEQEVMSTAVQSESNVITSSTLQPPASLHVSSSAEALLSNDVTFTKNSSNDIIKSPSGYHMAMGMGRSDAVRGEGATVTLPSPKELIETRQRKKLILAATEQFNKKPSHGITFLQERGVLHTPLLPTEVADFLLDNPRLDKAMIGEYVGDRRNAKFLEAFVRKFSLGGVPMVDALRHFLESFRLPGESPIIARILETFAEHWLACNRDNQGKVFANMDSVYILSYAIMMLNTDQHSSQVKKRMTIEEFIRNQRGINNKQDFPPEFLTEIYHRIRDEEIIMPDEHKGTVKENYKWKVLLYRSSSPEGTFLPVPTSDYDQDLFLLAWGPTIAALSYVFDNAEEKHVVQKAISGFSKCASVAAYYELREVFDNLIISLCKFTTLLSTPETPSSVFLMLGTNPKVRQSLHTMFALSHRHGDILREGWKNILDCLLTLFKAKLLPESLVEVEDYLHPDGKISLLREETPSTRTDSSLLSSLYSYWLLSNDSGQGGGGGSKNLSPSEIKARKAALKCVKDCHPEQLFSESKFLRPESLLELVKSLIFASRGPDAHHSLGTVFDEDTAVFFLELLISVGMENKDRIGLFWSELSNHLSRIILTAHKYRHLLERSVVGLLRLSIRLMSRESLATQLLSSLRVLLTLPPPTTTPMRDIRKQLANGISELVRSHSNTIKTPHDWSTLFTVIEYAGTSLPRYTAPGNVAMETVGMATQQQEVGVATDEEAVEAIEMDQSDSSVAPAASDWVWISGVEQVQTPVMSSLSQFDLLVEETLPVHDPQAFFKMCESLAYLVRSDHYVTSSNFSSCLRCIRTFAEISASSGGLEYDRIHMNPPTLGRSGRHGKLSPTRMNVPPPSIDREGSVTYTTASLQLLDLMDALYSRVVRIFDEKTVVRLQSGSIGQPSETKDDIEISVPQLYCPEAGQDKSTRSACSLLWHLAWCPLLQGMARMCCDPRRSVRQTSITYLQRALLAHELQSLLGNEWEACFLEVFFPMLSRLMEDITTSDQVNLEETRVRASNLLCKVFLQHLPSLSQLQNFPALWLGILDFMDKFLHLYNSDLLYEAIPESLKNMLLVMSTQGIFDVSSQSDSTVMVNKDVSCKQLWEMTRQRLDQFLPNFLEELFPTRTATPPPPTESQDIPLPIPTSQSPDRSPETSPQASPPRHSPAPDTTGPFPITLHPPLPTVSLHTATVEVQPTKEENTINQQPKHGTSDRTDLVGIPGPVVTSQTGLAGIPGPVITSQTGLAGIPGPVVTSQTGLAGIPGPVVIQAAPPYGDSVHYSTVYSV